MENKTYVIHIILGSFGERLQQVFCTEMRMKLGD